jgi:ABC-2 type transport system ATP-binding protein
VLQAQQACIQVKAVCHAYGAREVLNEIDLEVHAGEIYGLLGPNGAGKSTLMKAISGRLRPRSGQISIYGRDPYLDKRARRAVSFVPQDISIFPHLTVAENLAVFGRFAGVRPRDLRSTIDGMLARAGLADRAGQICGTLSGGYQRRVNICVSILQNPVALLLDEPTVGIDVDAREAIHGLLRGLRDQGTAMLLATHDLEQAQLLCDRICIMQDGRLTIEGEPTALLHQAFGTDMEVVANLSCAADSDARAGLEESGFRPTQSPLTWCGWTAAGHLDVSALSERLAARGIEIKEIVVRKPDLGSLFLSELRRGPSP